MNSKALRTFFHRMTSFLVGLCFLLLFGSFYPQNQTAIDYLSFGVKVGIMPTGKIQQYAIVHAVHQRGMRIQPVSFTEMYNVAIGKWPIPGTKVFHNYFETYGVEDAILARENLKETAPFDSIWKIRFVEHPFDGRLGKGWSQGDAKPSLKQQGYIYNEYGIRGYDQDYFIDTSFYKLLKHVIDENWINYYKSLR